MKTNNINLTAFFGPQNVVPHCGDLTRDEIVRSLVCRIAYPPRTRNAVSRAAEGRAGGGLPVGTDYLAGDTYFRTAYDDHNLVRCRTQFKMVESMEQQAAEYEAIVRKYADGK